MNLLNESAHTLKSIIVNGIKYNSNEHFSIKY